MREAVCLREILSAGRLRSPIFAITKHHLIIGAQKNTVVGPEKMDHANDDGKKLSHLKLPAGCKKKGRNFAGTIVATLSTVR